MLSAAPDRGRVQESSPGADNETMNRRLTLSLLLGMVLVTAAWAQDTGVRRLGDELLTAKDVSVRRKAAQGLGRASTNQSVRILNQAMPTESSIQVSDTPPRKWTPSSGNCG